MHVSKTKGWHALAGRGPATMLHLSDHTFDRTQKECNLMARHWAAEHPAQAVTQHWAWTYMPEKSLHALQVLRSTAPVGNPAQAACA